MNNRLYPYLPRILGACLFSIALCGPANADLVGTDEAAAAAQSSEDRERVRAFTSRPEVAGQLQESPDNCRRRGCRPSRPRPVSAP